LVCTPYWTEKYVFLRLVCFLAAWTLVSINSIQRDLGLLPAMLSHPWTCFKVLIHFSGPRVRYNPFIAA
jgi:hypothetical protein